MKQLAKEIIERAYKIITAIEFCQKHRTSEKYFTRTRCMGYIDIIMLCLNFLRKTLQLEVDRYLELMNPKTEKHMSKQAFSKARQKISPDAFQELFELTAQTAFELDEFGRYKGYRLFAIDGTELQLPKSKAIFGKFPQTRGSYSPHARVSVLCDVLTGITVHASIETTEIGEREMAMEHLRYFMQYKKSKDIILFDRGYPSQKLIKYLDENGFKYVMRVKKRFHKEIDNMDKTDYYIKIANCNVRVIKLPISNGETEILLTNLGRKAFKSSEFLTLYHMRWGVETKYNTLKNKLDIENFSGRTVDTVLQDFYATFFLLNVSAALKAEVDVIISQDNASKKLKHSYVTNENMLIGKLKDRLIMLMLHEDADERAILLDKLILQLSRYRIAVVPDRSFSRPNTSHKRACCRIKNAL